MLEDEEIRSRGSYRGPDRRPILRSSADVRPPAVGVGRLASDILDMERDQPVGEFGELVGGVYAGPCHHANVSLEQHLCRSQDVVDGP